MLVDVVVVVDGVGNIDDVVVVMEEEDDEEQD